MDARVWQRYVAAACGHAWTLDVHDTEQVLRCIEALLAAAPIRGSATVHVLLGTGVGELTVEADAEGTRIRIRTQVCGTGQRPGEYRARPRNDGAERSGEKTLAPRLQGLH
jgi:hypothetical protein